LCQPLCVQLLQLWVVKQVVHVNVGIRGPCGGGGLCSQQLLQGRAHRRRELSGGRCR
jgi:hypothetical protein